MTSMLLGETFKVFAGCSFVLCLLMFALGFITAALRNSRKSYANAEDKSVFPKDAQYNQGADHPDVLRAMRAHRNLIESLLPFSILGVIYVVSGASATGAMVCMIAFTVARILHAIVYLKEAQPWRTAFFAVGIFSMIGMMVLSAIKIFS
ncbi:MAG: MAPEG family protein [Polyangiaceae bacterium]